MRTAGENIVPRALADVLTLLGLVAVSTVALVTFSPSALVAMEHAWCTVRTVARPVFAQARVATDDNVDNGWTETAAAPPPTYLLLVAPARSESLLLNNSLHSFRDKVNSLNKNNLAFRLAYQSFELVAAERDSFDRTWFQLGRPNPNVPLVQNILLRLARDYSIANERLLTLQAQERRSGSVSFFTPPSF